MANPEDSLLAEMLAHADTQSKKRKDDLNRDHIATADDLYKSNDRARRRRPHYSSKRFNKEFRGTERLEEREGEPLTHTMVGMLNALDKDIESFIDIKKARVNRDAVITQNPHKFQELVFNARQRVKKIIEKMGINTELTDVNLKVKDFSNYQDEPDTDKRDLKQKIIQAVQARHLKNSLELKKGGDIQVSPSEDFNNAVDLVAQDRDQLEALGYLTAIDIQLESLEMSPQQMNIAMIFWEIGQVKQLGRMPTNVEFREFVFDKISEVGDDDTVENFGYGEVIFQTSGSEGVNLIQLAKRLKDQQNHPLTKHYLDVYGDIYKYARIRFDTRKLRNAVFDNYTSGEDLKKELPHLTNFNKDGNLLNIMESLHTVKDSFETPATERARAAMWVYEKAHIIKLIREESAENPKTKEKSKFFLNRFKKKKSHQNAFNELVTKGKYSNTADDVIIYERALYLREQHGCKFLTQDEAEFLLANMENQMPKEEAVIDGERKSRITIQLFAAAGPVRSDSERTAKQIQMSSLLTRDLKIEIGDDNNVVYVIGTNRIHKEGIHSVAAVNHKGQRAEKVDAYVLLEEMRKYGSRIEAGAHDLAWPMLQMAQADAGYTFGYHKEFVWMIHHLVYAQRYAIKDYAGPDADIAKVLPQLTLTTLQEFMVQWPAPTADDPTKKEVRSLASIFEDPTIDLADPKYYRMFKKYVKQVEIVRLTDNLARSLRILKIAKEGFFGAIGVPFNSFKLEDASAGNKENFSTGTNRKKIEDGFQTVLKDIEYLLTKMPFEVRVRFVAQSSALYGEKSDAEREKWIEDTIKYYKENPTEIETWNSEQINVLSLKLIEESIATEIRYGLVEKRKAANITEDTIRQDIDTNQALKNDLEVLSLVLLTPAIRKRGKKVGKQTVGLPLIGNPHSVDTMIKRAKDKAIAVPALAPEDRTSAFELYTVDDEEDKVLA